MKSIKYLVHGCFVISILVIVACLQGREIKKADLIIFSFDRSLQLYALLESVEHYITGLGTVHVIYRASDDNYANSYAMVQKRFNTVIFKAQGNVPTDDFKLLTVQAVEQSCHDYIMFAVDDIIVKDAINLTECITMLEKTEAYGFYLRLGTNLTECYSENMVQPLPPLQKIAPEIYSWQFAQGVADWHYPHTVDMTLYRKRDVESYARSLHYTSPNLLESYWAGIGSMVMNKIGLCYARTKIVNVPLNRVQNIWNNRAMNSLSPQELLTIFNNNMKMDIAPLYQVNNKAAHMEYTPQFVQRID